MGKTLDIAELNTEFKFNQFIVYPIQGVGQIISIENKTFKNKEIPYYIIYFEVSDMTIMVPTDKAVEVGIRKIVAKKESEKALKIISEKDEPLTTDWKLRYQINLELLKKGAIGDIAKVVRSLYHRSKQKELPILERKIFDSAIRLLIDEISHSLSKTKNESEQLIFARLEADETDDES
ncbi:MAG: CarD family transcriptional regulator [Spirochaetaceae bacterium]|nr:CarD family transcriptional regulator [Spirochaetaceae bacterium]